MKFLRFKMWLASIGKRTWIYVGIIAGFVSLAVAGLFVWMHICGYTLASWLGRYWPTVVIVAVVLIAFVPFVLYIKTKKGR